MAKFTVEEAVEALKGRFKNSEGKTSLQISDRTLQETLARKVAKAGDETELADFIGDIYEDYEVFNRNHIKDVADGIKAKTSNQPPAPAPKPNETPDFSEMFQKMIDAQKTAFEDALKPLREKMESFENDRNAASKADAIASKKAEMKLSAGWSVDFDNCVEIATLKLGEKASADNIFEKAKELFNATLAKRGEVYKPLEAASGDGKSDFSGIIEKLKAEKDRQKK